MALYSWVHLAKPDGVSDVALNGMRFLTDRKRPVPEQALSRFIQEVAVDGIGGEVVLERFERTLKDAVGPDEIDFIGESGEVLEALGVMSQLVKHPKMRELVQKRETFKCIISYFDERRKAKPGPDPENMGWTEWELALYHFECVSVARKRNICSRANTQADN